MGIILNVVFDAIVNFFTDIMPSILSLDYLTYIALGLFLVTVLIVYVKTSNSYEVKANKAIDRINNYLVANTYINEDNLVEFNKSMKKAPSTIRYQWQNYVLNRDTVPSKYLSRDNCVEKPLKTSGYREGIKLLNLVSTVLCILSFLLSLVLNINVIQNSAFVAMVLLRASILPAFILILTSLYTMFLRARINSITASLYQTFYDFERNIDKATTTLPDYIDYETLFTKAEIKSGIPLLQEYLEKRDRQQQEELKKAMAREAEHEKYDFDSTGINGSLLLERAMKESELFIVNRKRLLSEIEQLQTEYDNNRKNFDMATKEVNRKLQAAKENLIKFKAQQEQSTNRIETNYIRKQQAEEVRRQQQLEKDLEEAITKFDEAQASIDREIQSRNDEIEENRKYIEDAMKAEFETFSEKTYRILYDGVQEKLSEQIKEINETSNEQSIKIAELEKQVEDKEQITAELASTKEQLNELQKSYEQNQMLYNQLLEKFAQISPENIQVQSKVESDNEKLDQVKEEILSAIKNMAVVAPAETVIVAPVEKVEPEKTETAEPKAEEKAETKEEKTAEKPKTRKRTAKKSSDETAEKEKKPAKKSTTGTKKAAAGTKKSTAKSATATKKKPAEKIETVNNEEAEAKAKAAAEAKAKANEELKKKRAEARKKKKEEEARQKADALLELQRRIEVENQKLSKQQNELNKVISTTIEAIEETTAKPKRKRTAKKTEQPTEEQPAETVSEVKETLTEEKPQEQPAEPVEEVKVEETQTQSVEEPVAEQPVENVEPQEQPEQEEEITSVQQLVNKMHSDNNKK